MAAAFGIDIADPGDSDVISRGQISYVIRSHSAGTDHADRHLAGDVGTGDSRSHRHGDGSGSSSMQEMSAIGGHDLPFRIESADRTAIADAIWLHYATIEPRMPAKRLLLAEPIGLRFSSGERRARC